MKRFIEGEDRSQSTLFPEHLDDYIAEDNPVRVIDVFVDELDLSRLGFEGMERKGPATTSQPETKVRPLGLNLSPKPAQISAGTRYHAVRRTRFRAVDVSARVRRNRPFYYTDLLTSGMHGER